MKPRLLIDIKRHKSAFSQVSRRINLSYRPTKRLPLKLFVSSLTVLFFLAFYIFNLAVAPTNNDAQAAQSASEERKALEAQLAQLEKEMDEYETKISQYQKQGKSLQSEINTLNSKVAKINAQIKAININLQKLDKEINLTELKIDDTKSKIKTKKEMVAEVMQEIFQQERQGMLVVFLSSPQFSDFFGKLNNLSNLEEKLRISLEEFVDLNNQLIDQKDNLALEKSDVIELKDFQDKQKKLAQQIKAEKDNLLKITKGKESEYQKVLAETQKTAAQIRSRLFEMIGGGAMKFEDAYKFAKAAEAATGVRAALILAVLDKESALGKNVGKCSYKTAMAPGPPKSRRDDITPFLQITGELGLNPETTLVSCPISIDGAYGGAMGPSQFIPTTWMLYKDQVAQLTGNNPPSPWRNGDAFMATALYLKDAGAGGTISSERIAAARYYGGGNYKKYLYTYGDKVVSKAQQFQQDINVLNS